MFFKGDSDRVYGLGDTIHRPRLGQTLSTIAEKGPSAFYNGDLSDGICDEIQAYGGIINRTDLETYHARVKPSISIELENQFTAFGVPPPASSAITLLILKVMDGRSFLVHMRPIFGIFSSQATVSLHSRSTQMRSRCDSITFSTRSSSSRMENDRLWATSTTHSPTRISRSNR